MLIISHDLSVLGRRLRPGRGDVRRPRRRGRAGRRGVRPTPLHPYTRALSRPFPRIGDPAARYAPSGLAGDPPDPRDLPPGCSFAPRCPRGVDACTAAEPPLRRGRGPPAAACIRVGGDDRDRRRRRSSRRPGSGSSSPPAPARSRAPSTGSTSRSGRARSSRSWGSPAPARRRWPARSSGCSGRPRARCGSTASRCDYSAGRCDASAPRCRWCSRTRPARSTRGRPSTSPSPRASGCTGGWPPTPRAVPRPTWSQRRCRRRACARRSGSSCATRTSSPAASGSGC